MATTPGVLNSSGVDSAAVDSSGWSDHYSGGYCGRGIYIAGDDSGSHTGSILEGGGICGIVGINGRLGELCICVGSKSVLDRSAWALGALNSAGLKQQSGNSGLGGHGSSWLCSA